MVTCKFNSHYIYVSQGHIPMCKCVAKLYIVLPSLLGLALIDWAYTLAGSGSPVLNVYNTVTFV